MSDFDGRDISFETLAEVCGIDITQLTRDARGQLNGALKQIREATPHLADLELALVIEDKARSYRKAMPEVILSPSALAKHWAAVEGMVPAPETPMPRDPRDCPTCDGHRLVPALGGAYSPCPACNVKGVEIANEYRARMERIHGRTPTPPPRETLEEIGKVVHLPVRRSPLLP